MPNAILWGFTGIADIMERRVVDVGIATVQDAIDATLAEHERQLNANFGLFVDRTTFFKERFRTLATGRLQPLDEFGRALPVKGGASYDLAYPLWRAGHAFGLSYEASLKISVQHLHELMVGALMADIRFLRDQMLAALLYNGAGWVFTDEMFGAGTVMGLANGDATVYPIVAGADSGATDNHYLAQAAAIADASNPYPTIFTKLKEHPENQGEVVVLISTSLKATTQGLATFFERDDPNLTEGSAVTRLTARLGTPVPGTLLGYESSGVWIAEYSYIPAGYMIATTTEGPRALAMREDELPALRGFNRVAERNDHPWYESQFLRKAGFGARNRIGALVQRVGNASYAIPTGWDSPLA